MAINQSQVDHILSSASADDPEVKLQNLQDEVDLLKKSVKKLLIDLRERLNEVENPFIVSSVIAAAPAAPAIQAADAAAPAAEIKPADAGSTADSAAAEIKPEQANTETPAADTVKVQEDTSAAAAALPAESIAGTAGLLPQNSASLALLKQQIADIEKNAVPVPEYTMPQDRPKLKKLHGLFEWVSRMVRKYGHDRFDIMIESYITMRYISSDVGAQVREISKLMPDSDGEIYEITSEEFVSELYVLNRIITPEDSSLDREMIEVMMEKRDRDDEFYDDSNSSIKEDDWIGMLERV